MALGINFNSPPNNNPITVNIGDVTVDGNIITANGTPACVKYNDTNGDLQHDAILLVTVYDPADVTVQPNPVGLFYLDAGNVLLPYTVPGGATNVEYSLGDCGEYLADILTSIAVDISSIVTTLTTISNTLTDIDSTLTDIDNTLTNIDTNIGDIETIVTNIETNTGNLINTSTLTQVFCDVIGSEPNQTFQRFIRIYIINNDTGAVVAQSDWYNNPAANNQLQPYTVQGVVNSENCCPPDDCPPIINAQYICLQTLDPCQQESWNLAVTLDPLPNAEITLSPIFGNNAPYAVAWTGYGNVSPVNATGTSTPLTITGSGGVIASITVTLAGGGTCLVELNAPISCDAALTIDQTAGTVAYRKELRFPILSLTHPVILLSIGSNIYTAAEYTLQTGNPAPTMDDPAAFASFIAWIAAQFPAPILLYLDTYDPLASQNSVFLESCIDLTISTVLDVYGAINELDLGTTTSTALVCNNTTCLTATFTPAAESIAVGTSLNWQLGPGLTLVSGTLTDQTICVTGSGTAIVTVGTDLCGDFTETVNITTACDSAQITVTRTTGAQVCAGIQIDSVTIDEINRVVTFNFSANDTNTGVNVLSELFTQPLPGNILDAFAHPLDPAYIGTLNVVGNSGSINLPYPHCPMPNTVPIYNNGKFSYIVLGGVLYPTPGGIQWNQTTDPTGAQFEQDVQAFLTPLNALLNIELVAGVYVQGNDLYMIIRIYPAAGGGLPTFTYTSGNTYWVHTDTNSNRFTVYAASSVLTGVTFVRELQTECGPIAVAHQVRVVWAIPVWFNYDEPNIVTQEGPYTMPPNYLPWYNYPPCCTIPDTLTATINQGTAIAYAWVVSGGLQIVGGNPNSNTIQITGTGTVTVTVTTAECGEISLTQTIS